MLKNNITFLKKSIIFGILFLLTLCTGTILYSHFNSNQSQATSVESDITLNIDSVIAMSLTNCDSTNSSVLKLNVDPTPNGTFKSNCQTIAIDTNAPGYTLTTKSSSTTLNYLNPTTITTPPTIASTTNTTTTPNTISSNTWGFAAENRLNFDSSYTADNASNKYAALPTTDTTIYEENTFSTTTANHKFFYATKLDTNTTAGSYGATITYTAVAAIVPEPVLYPKVGNGVKFQETTYSASESCSALPMYDSTKTAEENQASTVVMIDSRNNQQYRVRRLQDGKCWMIDNMKLADVTLTPADSNVTNNYDLMEISSTHDSTDDTPYVDDPALNSPNKDYCINNTADPSSNFTESYSPESLTGCGYLYSYSAATAGTGDGLTTDGQNATGSICPVGWRLPTGSYTGDFAILNGSMLNNAPSNASTENSSASRANWFSTGEFSGSSAGSFYGSSWDSQGYYGYWWSSTVNSSTLAYRALVYYGRLRPGTNSNLQYYGYSVRCIL